METQVAKNRVVTLTYRVSDFDGRLVDPGEGPLVYLHGGFDDIFPGIEAALEGKAVGDSVSVRLQPDEAFGAYDEDLVDVVKRNRLPADVEVGAQFEGGPEGGDDEDFIIYRVTRIEGDKVVLDGNHPLAGMALVFDCTVSAVRPASAGEVAAGHPER